MRLTSEFWISALVRRAFQSGGFGAILQRGAAEAGAIYVVTRNRLGEERLYGPAPQTSYDTERPEDRQFVLVKTDGLDGVQSRLEKERRFDPDFWVVELEVAELGDLMQIVSD